MATDHNNWKFEARSILHDCDRSARYHVLRKAFYSRIHSWMMVIVVFSGSAAAAVISKDLLTVSPQIILIVLLPTLMGAIDLVWNPSGRARDHEVLAKRFYWVSKLVDVEQADKDRVREWNNSLLSAYEDEPDIFHALNAECYNAATKALGIDKRKHKVIGRWPRLFRQWIRYTAEDFPTRERRDTGLNSVSS